MMFPFADPTVGAIGPVSNCVTGHQNIFHPETPQSLSETSFLIGFCVLVRREALDKVGGIDDTLPGGDDFDLSIRLRKAGYKLLIQPQSFVFHHGFKTGMRIHGGPDVEGGWNSRYMIDRTNKSLIQKHGFRHFIESQIGLIPEKNKKEDDDSEGKLIRDYVKGEKVVEMGCGGQKTVPHAIGVDRIPKGEPILDCGNDTFSVADIVADCEGNIPMDDNFADCIIARHILEHCTDVIGTLKSWQRILKPEGRLIIAVPNQEICDSVPMNPDHVHAFTPQSLLKIMELLGFKHMISHDPRNGVSFVAIYEKAPVMEEALSA
jgi:predicted SAM-dependent methyltransferase